MRLKLRIYTVQLPHAQRKIVIRGLSEKVIKVVHEAGVTYLPVAAYRKTEYSCPAVPPFPEAHGPYPDEPHIPVYTINLDPIPGLVGIFQDRHHARDETAPYQN